ncbi:MAG: D-aminoacyl-tRNA deacylase [Mollicutes bacterium]|nr:D-aminoacyl-tRNA deacylase [Mollicutes bacterium]MDD7264505.1 D-aminoacyl-tRNA deacylase [bacterium]MDY4979720.1 D-aminoacyl-tRNA deacylase [Candidatus Onthovivens sp.]
MKIVLQNVLKASVEVNEQIISEINRGYLLLVSYKEGDNEEICKKMASKVSKLRIFMDENGKTNKSIFDVNGSILSISQFTLYADASKGNRPSFTNCMHFEKANELYKLFNNYLRELNLEVKEGMFGEDMKVSLINDGPFTLVLDSEELFK